MFRDKRLMIMAARDIVETCAVTRRYRRVRVELHGGMSDAGVALGLSLGSSGTLYHSHLYVSLPATIGE
jgi:hypothetical protein